MQLHVLVAQCVKCQHTGDTRNWVRHTFWHLSASSCQVLVYFMLTCRFECWSCLLDIQWWPTGLFQGHTFDWPNCHNFCHGQPGEISVPSVECSSREEWGLWQCSSRFCL